MNEKDLRKLIEDIRTGITPVEKALNSLKTLLAEDIGFASIDHHRVIRKGFPEVIWGRDKTAAQISAIIKKMSARKHNVLVTRVDKKKAQQIKRKFSKSKYYPVSGALTVINSRIEKKGRGTILVISAGTSDIPVAEEAIITAETMGNHVEYVFDVGVAGIHRLMSQKDKILSANVIIVVAGMEGALPSVVGGLVSRPVIAVPTSTGYGASFGGVAALLGMLNSCSAGVSVVNIDNGFGAGYMASLINL